MYSEQLTGSWILLTGLVELGSQPRAKWCTSNWRTRCQVRLSCVVLQITLISILLPTGGNSQEVIFNSDGCFTIFAFITCHLPPWPVGELFAQAPVKEYPGIAVETVSDSSRYFVLRIQDDNGEDVNVGLHTSKPFVIYQQSTLHRICNVSLICRS